MAQGVINKLNSIYLPQELISFINQNSHTRQLYEDKLLSQSEAITLDELRFKSDLPYLNLKICLPLESLIREALSVYPQAIPHRASEEHLGWKSLCLHGLSAEKTQSFRAYGYDSNEDTPYGWTSVAAQSPITKEFIEQTIPMRRFFRVRWMFLEPGGYILPHSDYVSKNTSDPPGLSAVNISIIQPENCFFVLKDWGNLPFDGGKALYIDNSKTHALVNYSNQVRVHMIVHGIPDLPRFEKWVLDSFHFEKKKCLTEY
jgi:hypothetical protein